MGGPHTGGRGTGEAIITADGLAKSYGRLPAVTDMTFQVHEGEIFGFLGPNGAGKSTTLRLLLGLTRPDRGKATVAGYDCWKDSKRIHQICGVAFEVTNLYDRLTAWENLLFFARLAGRSEREARWALDAVGLADRAHSRAGELSRGMRQRLNLARAVLHRPRVLFLDEPTAGLDPNAASVIHALILQFQEAGTTVFLTTHDMREAEALCHRVAIVHAGRVVALDTVAALKDRYGSEHVELTLLEGDETRKAEYPLASSEWLEVVQRWQAEGKRFWVHTREATLADVFHALTGASLVSGEAGRPAVPQPDGSHSSKALSAPGPLEPGPPEPGRR